jgi:hypothetical protein
MTFRRHDGADGPLHNVLKRGLYETCSRKPSLIRGRRPSATRRREYEYGGHWPANRQFRLFDHLDHAGGSLRQQYSDRLKIAAACDAAGFRTYHVAEHHGTPHGLAAFKRVIVMIIWPSTR